MTPEQQAQENAKHLIPILQEIADDGANVHRLRFNVWGAGKTLLHTILTRGRSRNYSLAPIEWIEQEVFTHEEAKQLSKRRVMRRDGIVGCLGIVDPLQNYLDLRVPIHRTGHHISGRIHFSRPVCGGADDIIAYEGPRIVVEKPKPTPPLIILRAFVAMAEARGWDEAYLVVHPENTHSWYMCEQRPGERYDGWFRTNNVVMIAPHPWPNDWRESLTSLAEAREILTKEDEG